MVSFYFLIIMFNLLFFFSFNFTKNFFKQQAGDHLDLGFSLRNEKKCLSNYAVYKYYFEIDFSSKKVKLCWIWNKIEKLFVYRFRKNFVSFFLCFNSSTLFTFK